MFEYLNILTLLIFYKKGKAKIVFSLPLSFFGNPIFFFLLQYPILWPSFSSLKVRCWPFSLLPAKKNKNNKIWVLKLKNLLQVVFSKMSVAVLDPVLSFMSFVVFSTMRIYHWSLFTDNISQHSLRDPHEWHYARQDLFFTQCFIRHYTDMQSAAQSFEEFNRKIIRSNIYFLSGHTATYYAQRLSTVQHSFCLWIQSTLDYYHVYL